MTETATKPTLSQHADALYASGMRCNCDLDNWQPERSTGHSWVCRIHKQAVADMRARPSDFSRS